MPCAEELSNKSSTESTLVIEVFGNTRIFRMDGRLGNDFLGGAVLDLSNLDLTDKATTHTVKLMPPEELENVLPKVLRERKRCVLCNLWGAKKEKECVML